MAKLTKFKRASRTAEAERVRTIRITLDLINELMPANQSVFEWITNSNDIRGVAKQLGIPWQMLEVLIYRRINDPTVSLDGIDEMNAWMTQHGVSNTDVLGEEG